MFCFQSVVLHVFLFVTRSKTPVQGNVTFTFTFCLFPGSWTFHQVPEWEPSHRGGSGRRAATRTAEEVQRCEWTYARTYDWSNQVKNIPLCFLFLEHIAYFGFLSFKRIRIFVETFIKSSKQFEKYEKHCI